MVKLMKNSRKLLLKLLAKTAEEIAEANKEEMKDMKRK